MAAREAVYGPESRVRNPAPPHAPRGGPTPDELEALGASHWRTPPRFPGPCAWVWVPEPGEAVRSGAAGEDRLGRWLLRDSQQELDTRTPSLPPAGTGRRCCGQEAEGSRAPRGHCARAWRPRRPCGQLAEGPGLRARRGPVPLARRRKARAQCPLTVALKRIPSGFSFPAPRTPCRTIEPSS